MNNSGINQEAIKEQLTPDIKSWLTPTFDKEIYHLRSARDYIALYPYAARASTDSNFISKVEKVIDLECVRKFGIMKLLEEMGSLDDILGIKIDKSSIPIYPEAGEKELQEIINTARSNLQYIKEHLPHIQENYNKIISLISRIKELLIEAGGNNFIEETYGHLWRCLGKIDLSDIKQIDYLLREIAIHFKSGSNLLIGTRPNTGERIRYNTDSSIYSDINHVIQLLFYNIHTACMHLHSLLSTLNENMTENQSALNQANQDLKVLSGSDELERESKPFWRRIFRIIS